MRDWIFNVVEYKWCSCGLAFEAYYLDGVWPEHCKSCWEQQRLDVETPGAGNED